MCERFRGGDVRKLASRERRPGLARVPGMSVRLYRLLLASGALFALSLALAVLDGVGWLVLPQPFRLAIPIALVLSAFLGIVLLSGAIGIPKKPGTEESAADASDADATEHSTETS